VNPRILASEVPEGEPVVIMLGAHSHGACEVDWVEKYVSVSSYTLSAAAATGKLISGFEEAWGIM
jgi:rRNA small subunit pseudouridine methyltransferase Nep1